MNPKIGSLEDDSSLKKTGDVQVPGFSFQVNTLQRGENKNFSWEMVLCFFLGEGEDLHKMSHCLKLTREPKVLENQWKMNEHFQIVGPKCYVICT